MIGYILTKNFISPNLFTDEDLFTINLCLSEYSLSLCLYVCLSLSLFFDSHSLSLYLSINRWEGLVKNSRFYNYTVVNESLRKTKHGDNYYADYLTDLVANDSTTFMYDSKRDYPSQ